MARQITARARLCAGAAWPVSWACRWRRALWGFIWPVQSGRYRPATCSTIMFKKARSLTGALTKTSTDPVKSDTKQQQNGGRYDRS